MAGWNAELPAPTWVRAGKSVLGVLRHYAMAPLGIAIPCAQDHIWLLSDMDRQNLCDILYDRW
jgi:hypothetical protein